MFATLLAKLVPIKDYIYCGIIVALLVGFGLFVHHERVIGADTVKAADAKVVATQVTHNQKVEANAQVTVAQIATTYADVVSAPPAADAPHLWLRDTPSCSAPAANASTPSSTDGSADVPAVVSGTGESAYDFGPPLDRSFEDADAQVTGLQGYIKACQTAGICKR